jgi:peptidoglycan/LPS O-acetylase OafA/YrhL
MVFVGNLFFVQGILVPSFGTDGPLWSLANEFWYYILFPLGLVAFRHGSRLGTRLTTAALFVMLCLWLRTSVLPLFPIWLFGAAVSYLPRLRLSNATRWLALAAYAPIVPLCTYLHGSLGMLSDYILGVATAIFIGSLWSASQPAPAAARPVVFARGIARFSYTLYVVHFPLLTLIAACLLTEQRRWQPTPVHAAAALAVLAVVVAYAYAVASLTEFHTEALQKWAALRLRSDTGRLAGEGLRS